jgi:hypothetical protein
MDRDCASDWTSEYDAVSGGDPSEGERSDTSHSLEEPNPAIFPSVDAEEWAQTVQIVRYAVQSDIPSDQDKGIIITLYKAIIAADPAVPKSVEKVVLLPSRSVPLLMKQCIALTYDNYAGNKTTKLFVRFSMLKPSPERSRQSQRHRNLPCERPYLTWQLLLHGSYYCDNIIVL